MPTRRVGSSISTSVTVLPAIAQEVYQTIKVQKNSVYINVNHQPVYKENFVYAGTTYVPLRSISEMFGKEVQWNDLTRTIDINDKVVQQPVTTPSPSAPTPMPTKKTVTNADLPYTINAQNGMLLTVNSYSASTGGIRLNITIINKSTVSNKGEIMTSTWDIYDGKNTLKFLEQDRVFWDVDYLRAGQSVTGDIIFAGLSQSTSEFTLIGASWQYIDAEDFEINFKIE